VSTLFGAQIAEGPSKALLFFDTHPLPTFLVNRNSLKVVLVNKAATAWLQLPAQGLISNSFTDLLIPADKVKTLALLQRSTEQSAWNTIVQIQKSPLEILTAEMHVQTLVYGGDVLHQVTLIDITSRYAKQEQLAATAKRYKGFIDQNSEGIYCQDLKAPVPVTASIDMLLDAIKESVLTECNDAMAQMYGYEFGSQMVGITTKELIDFNDEANILYIQKFITSDFKIISAESHEKDRFGNSVYFLNNAIGIVEDGLLKRIWGTQRDITHIKQVELKVRLLADLVEQTSDVLTAADLEYKPLTWNAAAEKVYGLTAEQVIGKNIRQYIDIHYHHATREEVRKAIHSEGGWRGEMSFIRPTDQKLVTLLTGFKLMKDENGEPLGYIISGTDITERKEDEKMIRLLASLVENTSDVLIAADLSFNTISWNSAAERLSGIKANEVIGKNIQELLKVYFNGTTQNEAVAILKEKGEWRGEVYFNRPADAKKITVLSTLKLFKDSQGVPIGYIISCTEITERKEAELLLQESEGRFRDLADSVPVGIWIVNPEDTVIYVNKYLESYTGYTNSELLGKSWSKLIHPDYAQQVEARYGAHFKERIPVKLIYKFKRADGKYSWVQETAIPRFLDNGTFLGYIGSVIDIDDTKKKEEQLQYQAIVLENVRDCIITMDLNFKIRSFNKTAEQWFGLTREKAIGKDSRELIIPATTNGFTAENVLTSFYEKGLWEGEISITMDNGERRSYYDRLTYLLDEEGNRTGVLFVGADITDRKRAEEKVLQSENFYRSLIANSLDGMLLIDKEANIKFVFPSIYNVLGYESEDMLGKSALEFVHPDDVHHAYQAFQDTILREMSLDAVERPAREIKFVVIRIRKKQGNWIWCMVRGHSQLHNPHINSIVIYLHDDSLRKNAIDALKESEERFRRMIHDLQVGVLLQDSEGKIEMANQLMLQYLNATEEEVVGRRFLDIITSAVDENENPIQLKERPLAKVIETKQPVRGVVIGIILPKTAAKKWVMLDINPILNDEGEIIHIITSQIDITERKKLENKLRFEEVYHQRLLTQATIDGQEKERREIGKELHDNIGQQLTTTKLYLDLAKSTADNVTEEMVGLALRSVSDVINEIRGISRSLMPPTLGDLGLIDSINDLIETLVRTQTLQIELAAKGFNENDLPENQKLMLFRIIQEQLNNIVKHACAKKVAITLANDTSSIFLQITDNGVGFDLSRVRKGLGLTNIRNRAELFGGKMEVITAEGKGCTLKVTVPLGMSNLSQFE